MIRNSALHKATTGRDRKIRRRVSLLMWKTWEYIANLPHRRRLNFECHPIARAISLVIPELKLVNGNYLGLRLSCAKGKRALILKQCRHSWLVTPDGAILDPYPVGFTTMDVVLVATKGPYKHFGGALYWPNENVMAEVNRRKIKRRSIVLAQHMRTVEAAQAKGGQ